MKAVLLSRLSGTEVFAQLVSPSFLLSTDSCVSFKYKLNTYDLHLTVLVEVMESRTAAASKQVALEFDSVWYRWENVSLDLKGSGWRRLVFNAKWKGEGYITARQVYLDDVVLSGGPCITMEGLCL